VLAVTAAGGNVGLEKTLANALALTALAGSAVPVHEGADRPLLGAFFNEPRVHGADGLGGIALPAGGKPAPDIAADAIRRILRAATHKVTLVGIAPVTNLALALMTEPDLAANVEQIVLMSGAWGEGNATPAAEFNALNDPEALAVLLACGRPVVFATLELTAQALVTPQRIAALRARGRDTACVPPATSRRASPHRRALGAPVRRCTTPAPSPGCSGRTCSPCVRAACRWTSAGPQPRPHGDRPLEPHRRTAQRDRPGNAGRRRVLRHARRAAGAAAIAHGRVDPAAHRTSILTLSSLTLSSLPLSLRGAQRRSNLLPDEPRYARQAADCFGAVRLAMTVPPHGENAPTQAAPVMAGRDPASHARSPDAAITAPDCSGADRRIQPGDDE